MDFVYFKKSAQVRKVPKNNKKKIDELKEQGFTQVSLDGKGSVKEVNVANTEIEKLKKENAKLKKEIAELKKQG